MKGDSLEYRNKTLFAGAFVVTLKGLRHRPGFCSFFDRTVLILQLINLFYAQNAPITSIGRYQSEFSKGEQTLASFN